MSVRIITVVLKSAEPYSGQQLLGDIMIKSILAVLFLFATSLTSQAKTIDCSAKFTLEKQYRGEYVIGKANIVFTTEDILNSKMIFSHTEYDRDNNYLNEKEEWTPNWKNPDLRSFVVIKKVLLDYSSNAYQPALVFMDIFETSYAVPYPFEYDSNGRLILYFKYLGAYEMANTKRDFSISCSEN